MDSFTARLNAAEGSYFRTEQNNAVKLHMENMVEQGKLPQSALASFSEGIIHPGENYMGEALPVTVINSRPASEVRDQSCRFPIRLVFPESPGL